MRFLAENENIDDDILPEQRLQLARALASFQKLSCDPRLTRIQYMRNKLLAHWAELDTSIELPDLSELFDFARETANVWECLAAGSGAILAPMEAEVDAYRKSAEIFWSAWNLPADHPAHKLLRKFDPCQPDRGPD